MTEHVGGATARIRKLTEENAKLRVSNTKWRRFGRNLLNQLEDWSDGTTSRAVYISHETEEAIRRLFDD